MPRLFELLPPWEGCSARRKLGGGLKCLREVVEAGVARAGQHRNRRVRLSALAAAAILPLLAFDPATVSATSAVVTHDEGEPALSKLETGGWSTKVGFNNLTDSAVQLRVKSVSPPIGQSCTVQFDTGVTVRLKPAQHESS